MQPHSSSALPMQTAGSSSGRKHTAVTGGVTEPKKTPRPVAEGSGFVVSARRRFAEISDHNQSDSSIDPYADYPVEPPPYPLPMQTAGSSSGRKRTVTGGVTEPNKTPRAVAEEPGFAVTARRPSAENSDHNQSDSSFDPYADYPLSPPPYPLSRYPLPPQYSVPQTPPPYPQRIGYYHHWIVLAAYVLFNIYIFSYYYINFCWK